MRKTLINKKTKKYTFFEIKYENLAISWRGVLKIHTVILREAKNLIFFFSSQKIKKEILRPSPQDDKERQIYKNFGTVSYLG